MSDVHQEGRKFFQDAGIHKVIGKAPKKEGFLDDDYDTDNPTGSASGRRNYRESSYLSGTKDQSPGEYLGEDPGLYENEYGSSETGDRRPRAPREKEGDETK